jgi:hypothetical protein
MKFVNISSTNFVECDDPAKLWIGEIIESGEKNYSNWLKRSQSLFYLFKTETKVFLHKDSFDSLFEVNGSSHPEILKKYLQNAIIHRNFCNFRYDIKFF